MPGKRPGAILGRVTTPDEQPDIATIRSLLEEVGIPATRVEPAGDGGTSWTWVVDTEWIVQLPKFDHITASLRTGVELMSLVRRTVSFDVPVPTAVNSWGNRPVMRHRMVPGRPLDRTDRWLDLAGMLRELHGVPSEEAAGILGTDPTVEAWKNRQVRFRELLEAELFPRLDRELRDRVAAEYDAFLDREFDFTPVFTHSDLGAEHVLVDPDTARPTGLIDFDWADVGDPALDFVGLLRALGTSATQRIIDAYGQPVARDRLLFHWWLNPCYELVYAGRHLPAETARRDIATISERLSRLPELQNNSW